MADVYSVTQWREVSLPAPVFGNPPLESAYAPWVESETLPEGLWLVDWSVLIQNGERARAGVAFVEVPQPAPSFSGADATAVHMYEGDHHGRSLVRGPARIFLRQSCLNYFYTSTGVYGALQAGLILTATNMASTRITHPGLLTRQRQLFYIRQLEAGQQLSMHPLLPLRNVSWSYDRLVVSGGIWATGSAAPDTVQLKRYPFSPTLPGDLLRTWGPGEASHQVLETFGVEPYTWFSLKNTATVGTHTFQNFIMGLERSAS